jgi:type IV fimbrial biogenesis protein FimT
MRSSGGFTLIEALIVIFMISLISGIAVPGMMKWRTAAKLRGAIENLKGDLELAKLKAIQENGPVAVNFSENSYEIFRDNGATSGVHDTGEEHFGNKPLPKGVRIDLSATTFPDDGFGGKRIRFKGRGTARQGTIFLVNSVGSVKKIIVSSIGRIKTE